MDQTITLDQQIKGGGGAQGWGGVSQSEMVWDVRQSLLVELVAGEIIATLVYLQLQAWGWGWGVGRWREGGGGRAITPQPHPPSTSTVHLQMAMGGAA